MENTSTSAQRKRLLEALQQGAVSTLYAREQLNIMAPAPRIKELRQQGHQIHTARITTHDGNGFKHRNVARYVLIAMAGQQAK